MGRTDDPQEPQEYQHEQHGGVEVDEIVINYNSEQQHGSYNSSNPMEPVQDQYPPPQQNQQPSQYPPPQQNQQPAQYPPPQQNQQPSQYAPPQQNIQMGTPPPNYPPPGLPTQYPPARSPQPMQFPPPPSQEAHQPVAVAAAAYNQSQPIYNNQYGGPQYAPQAVPQNPQMGANYNYNNMPQSPYKPASGVPMPNQFPSPLAQVGTQPWKTGLFDCMEDPQNAIMTACVPCLTFGQIAEIIDNGHTTCATSGLMYGCVAALIGIPCILSCTYRTKLRSRFGLIESPAPDWVTHCLCEWCALCQAYRELNLRGLDPSIGWQGNLAKSNMQQQQQMRMMPPTNQTMNYGK